MPVVNPSVYIEGKYRTQAVCLSIQTNVGILPSVAILRVVRGQDLDSPQNLNRNSGNDNDLKIGQKVEVRIMEGSLTKEVLFVGFLIKRTDQGQEDCTLWEAQDARCLLKHLYVRGCWVLDQSDGRAQGDAENVKFISRFITRVNPGGLWNCTMGTVTLIRGSAAARGGIAYRETLRIPMFAPVASLGRVYESPDEAHPHDSTLKDGQIIPWTPRRFLQYLWFISTVSKEDLVYGIREDEWRNIVLDNTNVVWKPETITSMVGIDPSAFYANPDNIPATEGTSATADPLDRKMPDMTFHGVRLLEAINQTLQTAGTHGFLMNPVVANEYSGETVCKGNLEFYPKGFTALCNGTGGMDIKLQRKGGVTNPDTAYDFELHEDYSEVCESVLVEGATVLVETRISYDPTDTNTVRNSSLKPCWTPVEETAFLAVIEGSNTSDLTKTWAIIPPTQYKPGDLVPDYSTWIPCDGELVGGVQHPFAYAKSKESVALARSIFPTVYRAFYIDSSKLDTALAGVGGKYSNELEYPRLGTWRHALTEQLQFFIQDVMGGTNQSNWTTTKYPIRLELKGKNDTQFYTANFGLGLKITGDGRLWFDGVGESVNGEQDCIYDGSLIDPPVAEPMKCYMKKMRLNIAMPMDHRVVGLDSIKSSESVFHGSFSPTLKNGLSGPTLLYVFSPDSYHESHQVGSTPSPNTHYWGGKDGTTKTSVPLNRYLPPGSEALNAAYAARRKLASCKVPRKLSSWKMIGIRPEYKAGTWIGKVTTVGYENDPAAKTQDPDYNILAPIESVVYQFTAPQQTIIGGLSAVGVF